MKHYHNYYVKFDDDELRQILKEISNDEVKERIRSSLGETIDPIDKFHATIAYYNNEVITICLKNTPCGIDKKQVERIIKEIENECEIASDYHW